MEAILRILALTRKELLEVLKDKRSRFTLLVPPIMQCLIYGYVATYDLNDVPYAVLDRDRSEASVELVAKLDGSGIFHRVANLVTVADIRKTIDEQRALLVLQIDPDFERRLRLGETATVQVIADGRNSNTAGTAMGYVSTTIEAFNAQWREAHGIPKRAVRVTTRAWYNPNLETRWHMIPALIGTLTMIQTLMLTGLSVAREREQGTFDQLLVTPFRPAEIMAGKALPAIIVGFVQATMILLVAQLWFAIPFAGSFVTLYAGLGSVSAGGNRHWTSHVVHSRYLATGDAVVLSHHDAVHAPLRPDDANKQHAASSPALDLSKSTPLRDQHRPRCLSRRRNAALARARTLATGDHRGNHAISIIVAISPPADMNDPLRGLLRWK